MIYDGVGNKGVYQIWLRQSQVVDVGVSHCSAEAERFKYLR